MCIRDRPISVQSAEERKKMIQRWNFVSVRDVMETMSIVRSICLPMNMSCLLYTSFKDSYGKPLLAAAGMGVVAWLSYYSLFALTKRTFICLVIAILAEVVVYMVLFVVVTKTTEEEMKMRSEEHTSELQSQR